VEFWGDGFGRCWGCYFIVKLGFDGKRRFHAANMAKFGDHALAHALLKIRSGISN